MLPFLSMKPYLPTAESYAGKSSASPTIPASMAPMAIPASATITTLMSTAKVDLRERRRP